MRRSDVLGGGDAEQQASLPEQLTTPTSDSTPATPVAEPASAPTDDSSSSLSEAWKLLQGAIRERIKKEQFETWFRRAALVQADSSRVFLAVQNTFARDWLQANYSTELRAAVLAAFGEDIAVDFVVDPELTVSERSAPTSEAPAEAGRAAYEIPARAPSRAPAKAPLSARRSVA